MSKTLPYKTLLASGVLICAAIMIFGAGCSTHSKKRGFVFRGDWAFEINRTPWVGHPGNTDIPGTEEKQSKSLCTKDKESSLGDSLLGPLASLKGKCRCKNCAAANGTGNINITSYNPTIANSFPNPMTGAYPGAFPPGSLSLPPGAIVVPTGVLMPNGTILPHHLFYSQNAGAALGNAAINPQTGQPIMPQGQNQPQAQMQGNNTVSPQQPAAPQVQPPVPQQGQTPQQTDQGVLQGTAAGQFPAVASPQGVPVQPPQLQTPSPMQMPGQPIQMSTSGGTFISQGQYGGLTQAVAPDSQNAAMQNALLQSLSNSNPMLINPAYAQVVPGLSMTGTQAPGYPPIGYVPSGYSPGYAQQVYAPPIAGPLGAESTMQSQSLAATGNQQGGNAGASAEEEEPVSPRHVAAMPYPRHHPVPTRPVYQRNMGMAPGYAALRQPMVSPYMTPNMMMQNYPGNPGMYGPGYPAMAPGGMSPQMQISQAAAQQERQMMLERQRQALIMQQNAAVQQSAYQQASKSAKPRRVAEASEIAEDDETDVAPLPPTSRVLLANHQTPILQPPPPRVSQVSHTATPTTGKKSRSNSGN